MRTVEIAGKKYEIRNKYEITHKACRRVELLIPTLFFDSLDMAKLAGEIKDTNPKKSKNIEKEIFSELLKNTEKFVEFIQMMNFDDSIKQIMGVMLTTDLEYSQIIELPQLTFLEFVKATKEEIGSYEDFTNGLGINIESNLDSILSTMTDMQKKEG